MKIAFIEAFNSGSHRNWLNGFISHSKHQISPFVLPGRFWKWRMHGAAISLSDQVNNSHQEFDAIFCTDMLDVGLFKSLLNPQYRDLPLFLYFHENQLTYPWSPDDGDVSLLRDHHYAFINYTSALVADKVFFNSDFHRESFLSELPKFLKQFPDFREERKVKEIIDKSQTLSLGMELKGIKKEKTKVNKLPRIVWNHRWEYDKNPEDFFDILKNLSQKGLKFELIIMGGRREEAPVCFEEAAVDLKHHIYHWGPVASRREYIDLLSQGDILPVTSRQDFFGMSVVEAIYAGLYPLLPNRMAYPQHIPTEHHKKYLFSTNKELEEKLAELIQKWPEVNPDSELSEHVGTYDWEKLIPSYDQALAKKGPAKAGPHTLDKDSSHPSESVTLHTN